MEEPAYEIWWRLHIKQALGEPLTQEEQATYEAGRNRLYAEESSYVSLEALQQTRRRTKQLESEYERLRTQYEALAEEIARLEARLSEPERQLLGVGD